MRIRRVCDSMIERSGARSQGVPTSTRNVDGGLRTGRATPSTVRAICVAFTKATSSATCRSGNLMLDAEVEMLRFRELPHAQLYRPTDVVLFEFLRGQAPEGMVDCAHEGRAFPRSARRLSTRYSQNRSRMLLARAVFHSFQLIVWTLASALMTSARSAGPPLPSRSRGCRIPETGD